MTDKIVCQHCGGGDRENDILVPFMPADYGYVRGAPPMAAERFRWFHWPCWYKAADAARTVPAK